MSIFKCEKCGCAENTALCGYNFREGKAFCSECDPKIRKWHGCFEKRPFELVKELSNDKKRYLD